MTKRKIFAGTTITAMAVIILASATPAKAALPPQGIRIEGAKTVRVGKTIELDSDIYPDDDMVSNWNIVWKSNKPSVAKVLHKRGDDTRIKGKKAGTAKITVRVKGTNLKATYKIKVQKAVKPSTEAASDKKKLNKYKKKIKKIRKEFMKATVPTTPMERRVKYLTFERKLKAVDHKIEAIGDRWDDRWGTTARKMEYAVDRAEDLLEMAEDDLEIKFGYYDD